MTAPARSVLVTGAAGFIGFHAAQRFLDEGWRVCGVDNFSTYYDVGLKESRAALLDSHPLFTMNRVSIEDMAGFGEVWANAAPDVVLHLAAQAGVRHSIDHPETYVAANLIGTFNVLELARRHPPQHLLAASTSSVYGANTTMPFDERQRSVTPMSFYAATKGATELMGHSYAHLFGTPTTFFRFFTVYGPWGRPDMALFKFTRAILAGEAIDVYNGGEMVRDFTYVGDLADMIVRLADTPPGHVPAGEHDSLSQVAPFRVVNIGGGRPTQLMDYIRTLEQALGRPARLNMMPMQDGDVPATEASVALLRDLTGDAPGTTIEDGVVAFAAWYKDYYRAA